MNAALLHDGRRRELPPAHSSWLAASAIGATAHRCLCLEIETWPKPGLVSHIDCGSHTDMDVDLLLRSAGVLQPFFALLATAGESGAGMDELRGIGMQAEAAMLVETGGVNAHRGAIFGLGLLCAAAGVRNAAGMMNDATLGDIVRERWSKAIRSGPVPLHSHGTAASRQFGVAGARGEAASGFASLYEIGMPALLEGLELAPGNDEASRVHAVFTLIASVDDTNLLHRGGRDGLAFAQRSARQFLIEGSVGRPGWLARAARIHDGFVLRHLSPGGVADLLAMSLFTAALDRGPLALKR